MEKAIAWRFKGSKKQRLPKEVPKIRVTSCVGPYNNKDDSISGSTLE